MVRGRNSWSWARPAAGMAARRRLLLAGAVAAVSMLPAQAYAAGPWTLAPSANAPAQHSILTSVACAGPGDCWAAGYSYAVQPNQRHTLIEHEVGGAWIRVKSPDAGASVSSQLFGIACSAAADCWAVGRSGAVFGGISSPLIEHYDGTRWTITPSANPAGQGALNSVTCTSTSNCWAAGSYEFQSAGLFFSRALLEHWDGAVWSIVSIPQTGVNTSFSDVTCSWSNNCWAVGDYSDIIMAVHSLIEHYDGASWTIAQHPGTVSFLSDVACVSSSLCWAVGQNAIEQNVGAGWTVVARITLPEYVNFKGIACASATLCYAVGFALDPQTSTPHAIIVGYNGSTWSTVPTPAVSKSVLNDVTCSADNVCTAVGYFRLPGAGTLYRTLVEHT